MNVVFHGKTLRWRFGNCGSLVAFEVFVAPSLVEERLRILERAYPANGFYGLRPNPCRPICHLDLRVRIR
jgi:hypothetical protein